MFGQLVQSLRGWWRLQEAKRELSGLSDWQLADIGVRRGDIAAFVKGNQADHASVYRVVNLAPAATPIESNENFLAIRRPANAN
jgi:uncharacterized protein YjiS (DUF1127 family)